MRCGIAADFQASHSALLAAPIKPPLLLSRTRPIFTSSSPDPFDGLVHSSERHDIDDTLDAMRRRELEHLHGLRPTTDGVVIGILH
jgi:hypothetical protein